MNLTVKRCLVGLVASAAMFGIARAQDDESAGTVQLGPQVPSPVSAPADPQVQVPVQPGAAPSIGQTNYQPEPTPGSVTLGQPVQPIQPVQPVQPVPAAPGYGNTFQLSRIDQVFNPRYFVDSRGGGLYGYGSGYSTIGAFVPYKLEENALLFASAMGMVTYDGKGGASVGGGWRYYIEGLDRVVGASAWFDLDNGHAQPYQQLGLSLESLGRYVDYRVNGYLPISHPDHILLTDLTQTAALVGNGIGLLRNNIVEQAYGGFDAEIGGPTPVLGRYGLNAYVGGYQLMGMGAVGGSTTGVSGRLLSQINEDVSFGVQVTNDHLFGLNTQFQVFVSLPNGKPGRWLRNLRVRDRLNQNVFRQYRVLAKTQAYQSFDSAINPGTHQPYFVENINPNLTTNGNGTAQSPLNSIAAYEALPLATRERVDMILVQPRSDATTTNLDTGANGTLELFNGQRLLSTAIAHTFTTDNFPGVVMTIPSTAGATDPMLFNSTGGNVITLASGTTRGIEVSGFEIIGSATGNGIVGNNNANVSINNNNIHGGLNGVVLANLSGTFAAGTPAMFYDNNVHDNLGDGISVTNTGSPPFMPNLDVLVQGNTFSKNGGDGLFLDAKAGATIGGLIGGANLAATSTTPAVTNANIFNANGTNGLELAADGGFLNFNAAAAAATKTTFAVPTFGIFNNTFTANVLDGLHIDTTNSSNSTFLVQNNTFGLSTDTTTGNLQYGLGLVSDSGTTTIQIGGDITTNTDGTTNNPGNVFNFNAVSAINLAVSGTSVLNYNIDNNTVTNTASSTIPAPHDGFTFTFNGTSGAVPFDLTNTSDPGVAITSMTWSLVNVPNFTSETAAGINIGLPILQPTNSSDVATGLSTVNGTPVTPGTNPLLAPVGAVGGTNVVANALNTGIPFTTVPNTNTEISQVLPLTFANKLFTPGSSFTATDVLVQGTGGAALTSASTVNSTVAVTFSNGLSATATVHLDPTTGPVAVDATGSVTGNITPGFGQGGDGIHVSASGASIMNVSVIENNTVTGYGGYGIHVETSGTAQADHLIVQDNTLSLNGIGVNGLLVPVFTGGGMEISRHDDSTLNAILIGNTITNNFNNGLTLSADGSAIGGMTVSISGNTITGNAANGLNVVTGGAAVLNFSTSQANFSGNGIGLASNPNLSGTTGDNMAFTSNGTSTLNVSLLDVESDTSVGSGLSATSNDSSTINLLVQSTSAGILNGTGSVFAFNGQNGVVLNSNGDSYMHASFYNTTLSQNDGSGLVFNRNGASYVRANIVDSTLSSNGVNGLWFHGLGSDPQDPNQQQTGQPNKIILLGDTLNNNGTAGVGQGMRLDLFGDSELVVDANATTFDNNAQNGIRIKLDPGAEFGYEVGNQRSILDNVDISNNGSNGIFLTSDISPTQQASLNSNLPFDAPSVTFMQISSDTGNTVINNNGFGTNATGLAGILMQYLGGNHDILITGDENPGNPGFSTVIQSNKGDGILSQTSLEGDVTLTMDKVVVGGPLPAQGNGGDGVAFETQASLTIVDGADTTVRNFNGSGIATLNINDSLIQNNAGNGINLIGNDFTVNDGSIGNSGGDLPGLLNATVTNTSILNNGLDGVNIQLNGLMGIFPATDDPNPTSSRGPGQAFGQLSTFTFSNNVISSNGDFGIRTELNAGDQQPYISYLFEDPQPTTPPIPFDPLNLAFPFAPPNFNTSTAAPVLDNINFSNWLDLDTATNAAINLNANVIQFNGKQGDIVQGVGAPGIGSDGVFIRVGTDAYLAANITNNTISGNVGNDLRIESFVQYNPKTGVAIQPDEIITGLTHANGAPTPDLVFLDHTAQLDLNLTGNVGNTINIQNPLVNSGQFPTYVALPGNTSPNGADVGAAATGNLGDSLKTNILFGNPGYVDPPTRVVQLFQVNNAAGLNTSNSFTQNGVTQDLVNGPEGFFQALWNLRTTNGPFPDPGFPYNFNSSPGNPFSP